MLRRSKRTTRMAVRWDTLLLAGMLAGGSVLIENSHRLDTGAPDEEVVGASTCDAAEHYVWKPFTLPTGDDDGDTAGAPPAPSGCPTD